MQVIKKFWKATNGYHKSELTQKLLHMTNVLKCSQSLSTLKITNFRQQIARSKTVEVVYEQWTIFDLITHWRVCQQCWTFSPSQVPVTIILPENNPQLLLSRQKHRRGVTKPHFFTLHTPSRSKRTNARDSNRKQIVIKVRLKNRDNDAGC